MPLKIGKTTELVQSILVGSVIPPGTIAPFGGGAVPQGWLLCDGSTVNRSLYPALFEAVGTVHGEGDGSTTFHLPDYRGRFLRGADNMGTGAAGRDPDAETRTASNAGGATGNGVGSVQDDAMQKILGSITTANNSGRRGAFNSAGSGALRGSQTGGTSSTDFGSGASNSATWRNTLTIDSSLSVDAKTSTESRSQNANVSWCIKV